MEYVTIKIPSDVPLTDLLLALEGLSSKFNLKLQWRADDNNTSVTLLPESNPIGVLLKSMESK